MIKIKTKELCSLCGLASKALVCPACQSCLPVNRSPCQRCAIPMQLQCSQQTIEKPICQQCYEQPPAFLSSFSPFLYEFPIDQIIHRLKYQNKPQLAQLLAHLMLQQKPPQPLPQALIPVPMYSSKQRQRGYNQAIYLAQALGARLKIPVLLAAVRKTKPTAPQHELSAQARRQNLRDSFAINPRFIKKLNRLNHVALVDDVMTTGTTLNEIARCLGDHIQQVDAWSVARTAPRTD